jgi:hypothetical protein
MSKWEEKSVSDKKIKCILNVHLRCTQLMEDDTTERFELLKSRVESFKLSSTRHKGGRVVTVITFEEKGHFDPEMDELLEDYDEARKIWLDALDDVLHDMCVDEPYTRETLLVGLKSAALEMK